MRVTMTMRLFAFAAGMALSFGACAGDFPIAGLTPNQRPAGAPVITVFTPGPGWEERMLHGISRPTPPGLTWVKDQGAWFTPFNRPGMAGVYDIRGWRKNESDR